MKPLFIRWLILTAAIMLAAFMIDGIHVSGFFSAFFTAAILGILNVFFRPILLILTLPINIITMGLFTFVINALMLQMASGVIAGFHVAGFGSALIGSLIISVVNWLLIAFIHEPGRGYYVHFGNRYNEFSKKNSSEKGKNKDYIDLKKKDDDTWE
ncbi:MAG: phage holin family protein [Desulfobacterales bacterium]|nr:phage holin family protein [Desulfobacterales bacterium]